MTSRQRYSSFNCRARGQTEYNLERNTSRSSSKASHSNNVCWIVSDSRDSQQGHCALRTSCVRLLELRRSWQPNRNFVFNLRPSRRDAGHALIKFRHLPLVAIKTSRGWFEYVKSAPSVPLLIDNQACLQVQVSHGVTSHPNNSTKSRHIALWEFRIRDYHGTFQLCVLCTDCVPQYSEI